MSEKHLYTRKYTGERTYWENKERTGVALVSRCGALSSAILFPHFQETTSAYTPDLEHLSM